MIDHRDLLRRYIRHWVDRDLALPEQYFSTEELRELGRLERLAGPETPEPINPTIPDDETLDPICWAIAERWIALTPEAATSHILIGAAAYVMASAIRGYPNDRDELRDLIWGYVCRLLDSTPHAKVSRQSHASGND